jgi:hypothetical protein
MVPPVSAQLPQAPSLTCSESLPSLSSSTSVSRQSSLDSGFSSEGVTLTTSQLIGALRVLLLDPSSSSSESSSNSVGSQPTSQEVGSVPLAPSVGTRSSTASEFASATVSSAFSGDVDLAAAEVAVPYDPFVPVHQHTFFLGPEPAAPPASPLALCQVLPTHGELRVYSRVDNRWFATTYYIGTPLPLTWYHLFAGGQ